MSRRTPAVLVDRMSTILVRDTRPDRLTLPKTMALPFGPFAQEDEYIYKTIDLTNSEPICYLKHRFKDLWIYIDKEKPKFMPLQRNRTGWTTYKKPALFWVEYLEFPSFVLYIQPKFGKSDIVYLRYDESYRIDAKTGQPDEKNPIILMGWTTNALQATRFAFTPIEWGDSLNINIPARVAFTKAKLADETYIISETAGPERKKLPDPKRASKEAVDDFTD